MILPSFKLPVIEIIVHAFTKPNKRKDKLTCYSGWGEN